MSLTKSILSLIETLFPAMNVKCEHKKVRIDVESAYCPDCGRLIHNEWYITRCACCGVKMKAFVKNGKIIPQYHYCENCGGTDYTVEKLGKITFVDTKFAVLIKREEEEAKSYNTIQCWQEKTSAQPKLLVQYL